MKCLLLFLLMVTPLFGQKMEVVALHVGKGMTAEDLREQLFWAAEDPFDEGDRLKGEIKPLVAAPFKSRFLIKGDTLVDFSPMFAGVRGNAEGNQLKVIFNETSGKLVMRGSEVALLGIRRRDLAFDNPVNLQVKFAIYDVPNSALQKMKGMEEELPRSAKKIEEAIVTTRSGDKGVMKTPEWSIYCEPNLFSGDDVANLRMQIQASFNLDGEAHRIKMATGFCSFDGIPSYLEIGSVGVMDRTAVLAVTVTSKLLDGTDRREESLKEEVGKSVIEEKREELRKRFEVPKSDKNGQVFKSFNVPPTFHNFIGSEDELSDDPFADVDPGDRATDQSLPLKMLKKMSPLVKWRVGDRLVDISDLLKGQGLKIEVNDFTILNRDSGTIFALLPMDQMELLDAITKATLGGDIPSHVVATMILWESEKPFTINEIKSSGVRKIHHIGLKGRPGDKISGSLSTGAEHLEVTLEQNIGANDGIIDLRLTYQYKTGKGISLSHETGVTVRKGQPILMGQHRHAGKWRALLVKADYIGLDEELGDE